MTLPTNFPDDATNGQTLGPAMEITEQAEADAYFETLVQHGMRLDPSLGRELAVKNLRGSLGYWAGYYGHETRLRVERLFRCTHPVFGSAENGLVDPKDAFEAGKAFADFPGTREVPERICAALGLRADASVGDVVEHIDALRHEIQEATETLAAYCPEADPGRCSLDDVVSMLIEALREHPLEPDGPEPDVPLDPSAWRALAGAFVVIERHRPDDVEVVAGSIQLRIPLPRLPRSAARSLHRRGWHETEFDGGTLWAWGVDRA
jgi:hypothetical protein